MNKAHHKRCTICGNVMRRVHFNEPGTWCWNCEPYRPGAAILPARSHKRIKKVMARTPVEFLKAMIFVFLGYGWAAMAYGIFPIR